MLQYYLTLTISNEKRSYQFFQVGKIGLCISFIKTISNRKVGIALENKLSSWNSKDISGYFLSGDTFTLRLSSAVATSYGQYSSEMNGQIIEITDSSTQINLEVRHGWALVVIFAITLIAGVGYIIAAMFQSNFSQGITGLVLAILGPAACIWFGKVANSAIKDRYFTYINEVLIK